MQEIIRVQRSTSEFPNVNIENERFFDSYQKASKYIGDAHPINRDQINVDEQFIKDNIAENYWYTVKKVVPGVELAGQKWPDQILYYHFIAICIE